MRKALLTALAAAAVALVLLGAVGGNRKAIARAQAEATRFERERDSLTAVVRDREERQAALAVERARHEAEAERLRDSVAALERRRADEQLTVRTLRTVGALQDRLRAAFPELGPRRSGTSLDAPGEVRDIAVRAEGDTWVVLDWKPPVGGGAPAAYTVQRRTKGEDSWENIATSFDIEELLSNQPRGVALEYRVIAVNKAGSGQASSTVTLVL